MIQFGSRGEVLGKSNDIRLKGFGNAPTRVAPAPVEIDEEETKEDINDDINDDINEIDIRYDWDELDEDHVDNVYDRIMEKFIISKGLDYFNNQNISELADIRERVVRIYDKVNNDIKPYEQKIREGSETTTSVYFRNEYKHLKSGLTGIEDVLDAIDLLIEGHGEEIRGRGVLIRDLGKYPPDMRKNLEKYGNDPIEKIQVFRYPLKEVSTLVKLISGGKSTYDQLFHLGLYIKTSKGTFILDKSTVWDFKKTQLKSQKGLAFISVDTFDYPITINEMLEKAVKRVGVEQHFKYKALSWNCQDAVNNMLNVIGGNNKKIKEFVLQDMDKVAKTLPSFSQALLDVGNTLGEAWDRFVKGEGKLEILNF